MKRRKPGFRPRLPVSFILLILLFLFFAHTGSSDNLQSLGKTVYTGNCASCHDGGFKGWISGAPTTGDQEEWAEFFKKGADKMTENTVKGTKGMKPKGGCNECTKEHIKEAVDYIISRTQ